MDLVSWRAELGAGRLHPDAARTVGVLLGGSAFDTSVFALPGVQRRRLVAEASNPEAADALEQRLFIDPYVAEVEASVPGGDDIRELRADRLLLREVSLARQRFQEDAQSLAHGALDTEAVLLGAEGAVQVAEGTFPAYAPSGFDLGTIWGGLLVAVAQAMVEGRAEDAEQVLLLPIELIGGFEAEYTRRWPERLDTRVYGDDILSITLRRIRSDAAIYAALEAVRRIVGSGPELAALPAIDRTALVRRVLDAARTLGVARLIDPDPARLTKLLREPLLS
ncbi:hypothetical protein [Microbacterium sp. P04]|uniref:hypothetical protein n=1 Tax=Microbacterium sp. P04 TaxID=3366947 RepID=UPI0037475062